MLAHCTRRMLEPTVEVSFEQARAGVEFWRAVKKAAKEQIDGEARESDVEDVRQ